MYQIIDGVQLTRKHRVCHVINEQGGLVWSGRNAGDAIEWMVENDMTEAKLVVGQNDYELKFGRFPI